MNDRIKVVVSVNSDLSLDQRVQKTCSTLAKNGFEVLLLGKKLPESISFYPEEYAFKRYTLWFQGGILFFANLNIRFFFTLLFSKATIFYANDLDTLSANYLAALIRRKKLIYDSHEFYTEVPELIHRRHIQRVWERIESHIVPKLSNCITVSDKIAATYNKKYGVKFRVLRNFPLLKKQKVVKKEQAIIYQGALNKGRGLEELIEAMAYVEVKLWIAGGGDIQQKLKFMVKELKLEKKVIFLGRLKPEELSLYTQKAKIGVSLEHRMGLNYTYALPNKIFDYIHAQTPVLFSDLSEVKKVLAGTEIGEELESYDSKVLGAQLTNMLNSDRYENWQKNCAELKEKLNWQQEEKVLLTMINGIG